MPKKRPPKYAHHKASGQARVRIDGQDIYLGVYGSPESKERYAEIIDRWLTEQDDRPELTIDELALAYLEHAKRHYLKNGQQTSEIHCLRSALRWLIAQFGETDADGLTPKRLKAVRQAMVEAGYGRKTVNAYVGRIKRMFQWAVSEELVSGDVHRDLCTVTDLRKGRTEAPESEDVEPVPEADVNAVLPHVGPQIRDMIRLQFLCGCRPAEICIIRPRDVDTTGDVWLYRPESHKTEHHEQPRIIFIGPKGQAVLKPWLERPPEAYCFSPAEAREHWESEKRRNRKTKVQPSQRDRRSAEAKRKPGDHYKTGTYRQAIHRGCDKASIPHWNPNQLRHSRATEIRRSYGIEPAQLALGHADANVTLVYAERDIQRAKEIMLEIG